MTRSPKPQSSGGTIAIARRAARSDRKAERVLAAAGAVARVSEEQDGPAIRDESLLFDPDWYRNSYPDVAAAGIDPIRHYFDDGAREGRDPNPFFSTISYMARYADVAASRMNPFLHYLLYGAREGRTPRG